MRYRMIGTNPGTSRKVSSLCLGAMHFGTLTDERACYAILDQFVEAGGTFIDTANNYAFWNTGSQGGESEELLGRWRRSRGVGDEIIIATKLGGRPRHPGIDFADAKLSDFEGLSESSIRESAERSRDKLGVERLDLLYAHVEDPATPAAETVEALAELVRHGTVGLLGVSNHWIWRVERARSTAATLGLPSYEVLQYQYTYLRPRTDLPGLPWSADGMPGYASGDLLSYLRAEPGLTLTAYSPLLSGAYTRSDRQLEQEFSHPGTAARRTALREVASQSGATPNQVVLAWMLGGDIPVIPIIGVSSVAQLNENLAAANLELTAEQRARLDSAGSAA